MNQNEPDPHILKQKKKKRRIILAVLLSVLLVVGLFALKIVLICTAKPTISFDYAAELNRISKPPNYDPNKNAAFDYQKAIEAFVNMPLDIYTFFKKWPDELSNGENTIVNKWITDNEEALAYLERGSTKPYLWLKVDAVGESGWPLYDKFDHMIFRLLIRVLSWQTKVAASEGRLDSALKDLLTIHRVGSQLVAWCQSPYPGRYMKINTVKLSLELLASKEIDSDLLADFQSELEKQSTATDIIPFIETERIQTLDLIQRIFTDDGNGNGHLIPNDIANGWVQVYLSRKVDVSNRSHGILQEIFDFFEEDEPTELDARIESVWIAIFGPDRHQVTEVVDKDFDFAKSLIGKTLWQIHQAGLDSTIDKVDGHPPHLAIRAHYNFLRNLLRSQHKFEIHESALMTTLAILRYKAKTGKPPANLQQLVDKGYLKKIPMDPYSDGPIIYKRKDDDFLLYGLDENLKDDGGTKDDHGFFDDIVFWPVEKKR